MDVFRPLEFYKCQPKSTVFDDIAEETGFLNEFFTR